MPRNIKCRKICAYPDHRVFEPEEKKEGMKDVVLSLDEYETLRILDLEGCNQEECAKRMGSGRTTVTAIYESARRKVAEALVRGERIVIYGGHVKVNETGNGMDLPEKGKDMERIAVTYENGTVFQHFGRTEGLMVYDIENGRIIDRNYVPTNGTGHGALAAFLLDGGVDALICGGIGMGAQMALKEAGITVYAGMSGDADAAAEAYLNGKLDPSTEGNCDHHDHHHGDHECGEGHCHHDHEDEQCHHHDGGHCCH